MRTFTLVVLLTAAAPLAAQDAAAEVDEPATAADAADSTDTSDPAEDGTNSDGTDQADADQTEAEADADVDAETDDAETDDAETDDADTDDADTDDAETDDAETDDTLSDSVDAARGTVGDGLEEANRPVFIPPADLDEAPALVSRPVEVVIGNDEERGWDPEIAFRTGIWTREGTDVGFFVGGSFALVEQGPQTASPYVIASHYARREVWGIVNAELGVHPGAGTDETEVVVAVRGVRTEVTSVDELESGYSEIRFGPVRYERAVAMDRELDLTLSVVEGFADRRYQQREGISTRVIADVGALGYEHIRYTPWRGRDHVFNGVRALAVDVVVAPEFALGESTSSFRYIAGLRGDIALGTRDGGLLVVRSDLGADTGVGGDVTEWVTWSALVGYRGAVDNRRPNQAGWLTTLRVEGRLP